MNICAATMARTDRPYEVKEWVNYHKLIGVDTFYIYDDFSPVDLHSAFPNNTRWFEATEKNRFIQLEVFEKFMRAAKEDNIDWLILTDVDEYIVMTHEDNLHSYLNRMSDFPAIELQMKNFSPMGYTGSYNSTSSIFDKYPSVYRPCQLVKTLVNVNRTTPQKPGNPHHFISGAVNCIGQQPEYAYTNNCATGHPCNINLPAWINHYPVRDLEQLVNKTRQRRCKLEVDDPSAQLECVLSYVLKFTNPNILEKYNLKQRQPELYKQHIANCDWLTA